MQCWAELPILRRTCLPLLHHASAWQRSTVDPRHTSPTPAALGLCSCLGPISPRYKHNSNCHLISCMATSPNRSGSPHAVAWPKAPHLVHQKLKFVVLHGAGCRDRGNIPLMSSFRVQHSQAACHPVLSHYTVPYMYIHINLV